MKRYLTLEGDVLDAICFKYYGHESGTTEAVLRVNPGLAGYDVIYPAGIEITMPHIPQPRDMTRKPQRLWG